MKQLEKTLLMTDLDGTLLPSDKRLAAVDLAAIDRFRHAGGTFSIATGRTLQAAQRYLDALHLDMPCILFNGAVIYDPVSKMVLDAVTLPADAVQMTRKVLDAFPDVSTEILRLNATYVSHLTEHEKVHLQICQVEPILMEPEEIPKDGWLKVLFTIAAERMPALIDFFAQQAWNCVDFVQSEAHFYEMLPKGVTKGSALRSYRTICHLEDWKIAAAGDFDNDLEMLRAADLSACPSNAQPCVKAAADVQLKNSCDMHAIAEWIDQML